MKNFENFILENSQMIFGGELVPSEWTRNDGTCGDDFYDTEANRWILFDFE